MKINFYCPNCKTALEDSISTFSCNNCHNSNVAKMKEGYVDFIKNVQNPRRDKLFQKILNLIDDLGYEKALELIPSKFSELKDFKEQHQNADIIFHGIGETNQRCLEIDSNLGDISETLSYSFDEIYSLEPSLEKIKFQKKRFEFKKIKNIVLLRTDKQNFPFPNSHFDLIVLNSFNNLTNTQNLQNDLLIELYRILKDDGCLLLGGNNKRGINFVKGKNSDIKKSDYTYSDFEEILNHSKFNFKSYWVMPSINLPYYSGLIEDNKSLEWFFSNFENFIPSFKQKRMKQRLILFCLKHFHRGIITFLIKSYCPSFLFCCYKNKIKSSLGDVFSKNNELQSFLTISRRLKILYVLFGKDGLPKKTVSFKKYFDTSKDPTLSASKPQLDFKSIKNQIQVDNWKEGRLLDPLNTNEILKAIQWIIDFQKLHEKEQLSKETILSEIKNFKEIVLVHPKFNHLFLIDWIKEYENLMKNTTIKQTLVHGDLSHKNMIINPKTDELEVIDSVFEEKLGNPLDDVSVFLFRFLIKSKKYSKTEAFRIKILGRDKEFNELRKKIEEKLSIHFGFQFDLVFIMKIYMLKIILAKIQKRLNFEDEIRYIEILSKCN